MISYKQALNLVLKNTFIKDTETIDLKNSFNRVLAQDIYSDIDNPGFNRVTMDGYAVRKKDIINLPHELSVVQTIGAGEVANRIFKKNQAAKIMTGCVLPKGLDRVIKFEDTISPREGVVKILKLPKEKNISYCGKIFKKQEKVLSKNDVINAPKISLLSSVGKNKVMVYQRPRVCLFATGNELVESDKKIKFSQVRNSTGPMLVSLLENLGIEIKYLGIAKDDFKEIINKIKQALNYDIVIILGGVSAGIFDYVPKILEELGVKKIFHRVSIKPGKPLWFGRRNKTLVFGLPGNPVSSYLTFLLFIKPAILKIKGQEDLDKKFYKAKLINNFKINTDRLTFYPAYINYKKENFYIKPSNYYDSSDMKAVTKSNGFLVQKKGKFFLKKNQKVDFIFI
ncbi:MAG: molybdopterin molybdotransferase MoeA [Candidatus Omnitrophota bacterium]